MIRVTPMGGEPQAARVRAVRMGPDSARCDGRGPGRLMIKLPPTAFLCAPHLPPWYLETMKRIEEAHCQAIMLFGHATAEQIIEAEKAAGGDWPERLQRRVAEAMRGPPPTMTPQQIRAAIESIPVPAPPAREPPRRPCGRQPWLFSRKQR